MSAAASAPVSPEGLARFERHRPEDTTLHRVVRENLLTLYAALEAQGTELPAFVRRELEGYLACGLVSRGFALLRCDGCRGSQLVAFSCKSRAFCPSCLGRRMAQTAANLVERVLPAVGLRQWVLTLPFALRPRVAYDADLLGAVGRLFADSVLGFYRRRMARAGHPGGRSGAITVVQRTSSDLRLNPHLHGLFLDGVFAERAAGELAFHTLPHLRGTDVAEVLVTVRVRVLRLLQRRGLIDDVRELTFCDDEPSESEPVLAQLATTAITARPPAGPERRLRPIPRTDAPAVRVQGKLCVADGDFTLHAATRAGALDERGREALIRYVLRPPLAEERLRILPDELVRLELRRPFSDGTVAIDMDPLSLLWRLCAAVPAPRRHTVVYSGVLASASRWRSRVVPVPPPDPQPPCPDAADPEPDALPAPLPRWRPRAELLARTFQIDAQLCARCGGRLRLLAIVHDPASITRILAHLGEPSEPPPVAQARDPPSWKSRVLRQRPATQRELF